MKVVIDCNIVISAGLNQGNCRNVVRTVVNSHECILSADILREYVAVSKREKFAAAHDNLVQLIYSLSWNANFVMPKPSVFLLPDAKDQNYLDTALSGGADVVVSGNLRHFPESDYMNVRVISPKVFLELVSLP